MYLGRIRYYGSAKHPRRKAGGSNRSLIKPHPRGQDPYTGRLSRKALRMRSFRSSRRVLYRVSRRSISIEEFSLLPYGNCSFRMIRGDRFADVRALMDPKTRVLTLWNVNAREGYSCSKSTCFVRNGENAHFSSTISPIEKNIGEEIRFLEFSLSYTYIFSSKMQLLSNTSIWIST